MLIPRCLLPASLLASGLAFWYARETGGDLQLALALPAALILLAGMAAERLLPYRADWSVAQGDTRTDASSAALLFGVVDPALKWLLPLVLTAQLAPASAAAGWASLPFLAQLLIATLLAEFSSYWAHRLHHALPGLWWLHALHHGSGRLYALNNFRIHPLNYMINYLFCIGPLLLLGVPADVILAYLALSYPVLMLQHANLPLRSGWLNHVFSTNEVHRWHHADTPGEGEHNFGRALVLWDKVFGTFRYLPGRDDPRRVGLYRGANYPARAPFLHQVLSLRLPSCCRAAA
ncbi:sterol desaturase family protein [Oxalobacteraceae bacterium]|nr:sterol desaturase family protein [Oxalobacteraceae bacterium]